MAEIALALFGVGNIALWHGCECAWGRNWRSAVREAGVGVPMIALALVLWAAG